MNVANLLKNCEHNFWDQIQDVPWTVPYFNASNLLRLIPPPRVYGVRAKLV